MTIASNQRTFLDWHEPKQTMQLTRVLGSISWDKVECKLSKLERKLKYGEKLQLKLSEILPGWNFIRNFCLMKLTPGRLRRWRRRWRRCCSVSCLYYNYFCFDRLEMPEKEKKSKILSECLRTSDRRWTMMIKKDIYMKYIL